MEEINRYWFSKEQKKVSRHCLDKRSHVRKVKVNGEWHEYTPYLTDQFGTALDQFNVVHSAEAIEAEALRINMTPKDNNTAIGILELIIE